MSRSYGWSAFTAGVMLLCSACSFAGQSCGESELEPQELANALELAEKTRQYLLTQQAQTAIIARVGQDLAKYGLRYSHLGMVYQDKPGHFTVLHELNECGSDRSGLYEEGLGNFFLDDVYAFEVLVIIPPKALQTQLNTAILNKNALKIHFPEYNMLAYPFSDKYQNSNQWGLELIAHVSHQQQSLDRAELQTWLAEQNFQPGVISVDPVSRMGASAFRANVTFTDHPLKQRLNGEYQVVTVESVQQFLQQKYPNLTEKVLSLP
jgi:hypothetical protein